MKITLDAVVKGFTVAMAIGGAYVALKMDTATLQADVTNVKSDIGEIKQDVAKLTDRFIDRGFKVFGMRSDGE